jgi:hypothetical protein
VTGAYTAKHSDEYLAVSGSAPVAITLPASSGGNTASASPGPGSGGLLIVADEAGNAATHNITLTPAGSETIDGASSYVLNSNRAAVTLLSTPNGWKVL